MSLKRKLHNEHECVIYMEQCINDYYICSKCGHQIHIVCFEKCIKSICSICKNIYNKNHINIFIIIYTLEHFK